MNALTRITAPIAMACAIGAVPVAAPAQSVSCLVDISRTELGFIVTVGGGKGALSCQGHERHFRLGGLQFGGMGLSGSKATGEVFNLKTVQDFEGTYTGGEAQITAVKGVGKLDLTNENGVRMVLTVKSKGGDIALGAQGLKVTFE